MGSRASQFILLLTIGLFSMPWVGQAENIDPGNNGSQYAYGENVGWINLQPLYRPGVTVNSTALSGYAWGENIGWINLSPSEAGVLNDGFGNLSGYAWAENVGWINFGPSDGGVFIDECGDFNGEAWGENIGWISFRSGVPVPFKVSASWRPPDVFPPTTSVLGPGSSWYKTDVSVSFNSVDNVCGSGVRDIRYTLGGAPSVTIPGATAFLTITEEGYNILNYLSTDNANNAEASHLMTVKIDKTPPAITLTTPVDMSNYFINNNVLAAYGADDPLSGIASLTGTVQSGNPINTGSIGTKSFSVTATDAAGNAATVMVSYSVAFPGNIDPDSSGCHYAWAENVGWINLKPTWGPGITVTDAALNGMAWGENIGWINLSPANAGVVNDDNGNLSGYAWGENVGWIDFAPADGGVHIESNGRFVGYAWGENIGWINFGSSGSCVKTSWVGPTKPVLSVAGAAGNATGVVSGATSIDCSIAVDGTTTGTCFEMINPGTPVTLTATPQVGAKVVWTGCDSSNGNICSIIVNTASTVTASFTMNQYTLTVNKTGNGSGSVEGGGTFDYGTTHKITAVAGTGSTFTGWSGDCTGMASPLDVFIDRAKTCTATFTLTIFTVSASVSGGHGTISPASQTVNFSGIATINMYPDVGYRIASITDNGAPVTIANPYVIANVTSANTVVVTFALIPYTFYGFFSPVDNLPTVNTVKAGQTIPVKWRITDSNGNAVSDPASFASLTSSAVGCANFSDEPTDVIEEVASGNSGLQNLGNGNWQFNWSTPKTYSTSNQQCRVMLLNLRDGSKYYANFKFIK